MDLAILGFMIMIQIFFLLFGTARKIPVITILSSIGGFVIVVELISEGSTLIIGTGSTPQTISPFLYFIIMLPTFAGIILTARDAG